MILYLIYTTYTFSTHSFDSFGRSKSTKDMLNLSVKMPDHYLEKTAVSENLKDQVWIPFSNIILNSRHISSSSSLEGTSKYSLTDGKRRGIFEDKNTFFSTQVEINPWIKIIIKPFHQEVDGFMILRIWLAESACKTDLSLDKLRNTKCRLSNRRENNRFSPSRNQTLRLEIFSHTEEVLHFIDFETPRIVYVWRVRVPSEITSIRISIRSIVDANEISLAEHQLQVAEVELWSKHKVDSKTFQVCSSESCYKPGGSCSRDKSKCICKPEYIGNDCSFHLRANTRYLPQVFTNLDVAVFQKARVEIQKVQSNCRYPAIERILPGPKGKGAGFGSTIMWRTGQFTDAFKKKRAYLFDGILNYAENTWCREKGLYGKFECYFVKEHNCSVKLKRKAVNKSARNALTKMERDGPPRDTRFDSIPRVFTKIGLFFWRSEQISWLLRINEDTKKLLSLDRRKSEIGFQKNRTIGIHVRHGDGCLHGRRKQHGCKPLSDYIMEARTIRDSYGENKNIIFLATDSEAVVKDVRKYENEFTFIFQKMQRNVLKSGIKIENRFEKLELNPHDLMISTLTDIFLLAECDFLVTHQASSLSRLSLHLATMRLGYVPPFISLDGPWCFHWRMCCDVKTTGEQKSC